MLSYSDALTGARAALRCARDAARRGEPSWDRLLLELPLVPPTCTLDSTLQVGGEATWPGGVTQRHRIALRPMAEELFKGYDATYHGTIDVGQMGVWSMTDLTAVGFVADLSFKPFLQLTQGGFGDAPTRPGHTLLLINPRLTRAANIGQLWEGALRRDAEQILGEGWRWIYAARPLALADGSCGGAVVTTCVGEDCGGDRTCTECIALSPPRLLSAASSPARSIASPFDAAYLREAREQVRRAATGQK